MRRFGHKGAEAFHGIGLNAKLSEFHAAMGSCNLNHIADIVAKRKTVCDWYDRALFQVPDSGDSLSAGKASLQCSVKPEAKNRTSLIPPRIMFWIRDLSGTLKSKLFRYLTSRQNHSS